MAQNKELYEEKDLRTHVYDAPDTYAGGITKSKIIYQFSKTVKI